jgi:hypothetical protein
MTCRARVHVGAALGAATRPHTGRRAPGQVHAWVSEATGADASRPSLHPEAPAPAWQGARGGPTQWRAATPRGARGARPNPASTAAFHVPGAAPSGGAGSTQFTGELGALARFSKRSINPYHNLVGTQDCSAR